MQNVSVCIVTPSYPTKIEPYSAFFIRDQAVALRNKGCKVSVVSPRIFGRGSMVSTVNSISIYNFSFLNKNKRLSEYKKIPILMMSSYLVCGIKKLFQVVRQEHCNIIHAHWVLPSGFIAIIVGKYLLRKPVVITAHGSDITVLPKRSRLARKLVKFTLKKADHVIVVCQSIRDTIVKNYKIAPSKINVIRLGIDFNLFKPGNKKKARVQLGLPLDKKIILFAGDLVEIKGLNYLIEAAPHVLSKNPRSEFILIGEGSQKSDLQKLTQELRVNDNIKFLGSKPHSEIPLWMQAADIFVLPSLSEGAPVSLMEAAAVRLPIIATDVGSVMELVKNGVNGLIIKSRDKVALTNKINTLLQDRNLYLSLRQSPNKDASELSVNKLVVKVKAIYQKLLTKG